MQLDLHTFPGDPIIKIDYFILACSNCTNEIITHSGEAD